MCYYYINSVNDDYLNIIKVRDCGYNYDSVSFLPILDLKPTGPGKDQALVQKYAKRGM